MNYVFGFRLLVLCTYVDNLTIISTITYFLELLIVHTDIHYTVNIKI